MITPVIETQRMILRPLSLADSSDIYERWTSDKRVAKYVSWSTHASIEDTKQWLAMEEKNVYDDHTYQWGFTFKDTGYLFGSGGIHFNAEEHVYELGYNIMHKYWNQGLTTEAAKAIIHFGVTQLGIKEFIAWHAVDNPASGAVMKKCGFIYVRNKIHTKFDGITTYEARVHRLKVE